MWWLLEEGKQRMHILRNRTPSKNVLLRLTQKKKLFAPAILPNKLIVRVTKVAGGFSNIVHVKDPEIYLSKLYFSIFVYCNSER